jgi:hypothetical protein
MSAVTATQRLASVLAACRQVIAHPDADPEAVAQWALCSIDTIRRMAANELEAAWTVARVLRLAAFERQCLGTDRIDRALAEPPVQADPEALARDVLESLPSMLDYAREVAVAAADGRIDASEEAKLERMLPALMARLGKIQGEIAARRASTHRRLGA